MSSLRARCPDCRTFTAVAVELGYECHACGREFAAGLVRVPRAWGANGEAMADGANLALPVSGDGDRGQRLACRADRGAGGSPSRAAPCPRRLLLRARGRGARARRPCRSPRRRLDRRSRRSEHAPDVSVREPLGDAAADAPGRRCRDARGRRPRRSSQSRSTRAGIPGRDRDRRLARPCAGGRRLPSTSRSISTCSIRPSRRSSFPSRTERRPIEIDVVLRDVVSRAPLAGVGVTGHVRDERNTSGRLASL